MCLLSLLSIYIYCIIDYSFHFQLLPVVSVLTLLPVVSVLTLLPAVSVPRINMLPVDSVLFIIVAIYFILHEKFL